MPLRLAGFTAGGDLHPALKIYSYKIALYRASVKWADVCIAPLQCLFYTG